MKFSYLIIYFGILIAQDVPDSFNYLYGKKRVLELIMGIDNVDEGEDDVSET